MKFLQDSDASAMRKIFSNELGREVKILFFSKRGGPYCKETEELLKEVSSQSNNMIKIETFDFNDARKELEIFVAPAMVICANNGSKLFYFGMPGGYQLQSLVQDIVDASRGSTDLSADVKEKINSITKPTNIKVFVTPACPYSPIVVRTAHRFAIQNQNIRAEMIESLEFSDLTSKYHVIGVPKTIINETTDFAGTLSEDLFADKVLEAASG